MAISMVARYDFISVDLARLAMNVSKIDKKNYTERAGNFSFQSFVLKELISVCIDTMSNVIFVKQILLQNIE